MRKRKARQKANFVRSAAGLWEDGALKGRFNRLVLIAPPKALGDLRSLLAKNVSRLVSEESPKDFVNVPVARVAGTLARSAEGLIAERSRLKAA